MRLAISAQERPARNALTVVVSYVNPTRKPVVDAARSSAHPVYRCIKACTRKEPQRTTAKISLAKAHSCAGVVRVRFMDRKERGLTLDVCKEFYWIVLATEENALLALLPTRRIVPTTSTKITANITAYSAMS